MNVRHSLMLCGAPLVLGVLAACDGTEAGSGASSATAVPSAPSAKRIPTDAPAPTVTPPPTPPPYSGYGATDANWESTHRRTPGLSPGAAYDPDSSLGEVNGRPASRFFDVQHAAGHVTSFVMYFRQGTRQAEATLAVMQEFPPDVQVLRQSRRDTCQLVELQSNAVGKLMSDPKINGANGKVQVEYDSDSDSAGAPSYSASSVREAIVSPPYATYDDTVNC